MVRNPRDPQTELEQNIRRSEAVFVVLSPHVLKSVHTHSWVAAESGLARGAGIPVFVFEDWEDDVDFPVPFADFYARIHRNADNQRWLRGLVQEENYRSNLETLQPLTCPYQNCRAHFRSLNKFEELDQCPTCRRNVKAVPE